MLHNTQIFMKVVIMDLARPQCSVAFSNGSPHVGPSFLRSFLAVFVHDANSHEEESNIHLQTNSKIK